MKIRVFKNFREFRAIRVRSPIFPVSCPLRGSYENVYY